MDEEGVTVTIDYAELKAGAGQVAQAFADVRSARNLISRRKRQEERDERAADGARRRRKAISDREADAFLKRRLWIKVPESDRPRTGSRTPRRLFTRAVDQMLKGTTGLTDARGPDGRHSIHYSFTARGFGSRKGRRWRAGEAARAGLYSVREEALEDGELGWWSNIAHDRNELVAHYRASEALEKHDRTNANVYLVEIIALPAELTAKQRRAAARRICRQLDKLGLAYTVGIHRPDAAGDQRNFHLHLVYSMRPCRRVAPYEWEFGTAKLTEINTTAGIFQRRCGVVVAINETLREAGIAKRYTPLSNRERGMAPPARGKVGQQETAMSRRLAALEDRQARLAALQQQARWIRQTLLDAADRLEAARRKVTRRLVQTSIALGHDEAQRITPAELRGRVRGALEHAYEIVDRTAASADRGLVMAQRGVRRRLRSAATQIQAQIGGQAIADHRIGVIERLNAAAVHVGETVRRVRTGLEQGRLRMAATEEPTSDREPRPEDTVAVATDPDPMAAIRLTNAIADAEREKAEQAARKNDKSLADKASTALKRSPGLIERGESGPFGTDTAGQLVDLPLTSPDPSAMRDGHDHHDQHSSKEKDRGTRSQSQYKALPRRRAGLRPIAGLAGLRVLRAFDMDDRPQDAARLLPDVRGADVRRGNEVHLEVRGAPADRVIDAADATASPASEHAPGREDPAPKRDLNAVAEDLVRAADYQQVRPKGPADDSDGTMSGSGRGSGQGGHGR